MASPPSEPSPEHDHRPEPIRKVGVEHIDLRLLERYQRYEDPRSGISEEFLRPTIGGAGTVAVLSRPLGSTEDLGFVVCPSFGSEHTQMDGLEVRVARTLAAAGFPVLRYHGQGYGDSEGPREHVGASSHLADAADAVGVMAERGGVGRVATVGGLFGASVAALTAERLSLPATAMWQPVTNGHRYAEQILRGVALWQMTEFRRTGEKAPLSVLREQLDATGVDIRGFVFTKQAYDEIAAVDLMTDLVSFRGASLTLGVSRSEHLPPAATALVEHLRALGGVATHDVVRDKLVHPLGAYRYVGFADRHGRLDTQFVLNERIADATLTWARTQAHATEASA